MPLCFIKFRGLNVTLKHLITKYPERTHMEIAFVDCQRHTAQNDLSHIWNV